MGAMSAHKLTEITIETERVLIIRRRQPTRGWCQDCGCEVDMVGAAEAQALTGIAQPLLRDCAQARMWHFREGAEETTLVCLESILRSPNHSKSRVSSCDSRRSSS